MAVDAIVFPLVARRISGATLWSTDISVGLNGDEVRNANWRDSLRRFNLSYGIKSLADQFTLENWFMVCLGPVFGFLMRDEKDFKVVQGDTGFSTIITGTTFQLEKNYTNGFRSHRRKITRPQAGTVTLYDAALTLIGSGYTLDTVTGIATFTGAATNEVQTLTISGAPTGGTFTPTFLRFGVSYPTTAIAYNATAATVQAAFEALSIIGTGGCTVTGNAGGPYTVTFVGTKLASANLAQMTAAHAFTGGTTPSIAVATTAQGGPGPDYEPRWAGNFYCPVRFQEDEIPWDVIKQILATGVGYGELPEVICVEVRE